MRSGLGCSLAVALCVVVLAAHADMVPEDSGISLAGGYSQVKVNVPALGGSRTPSGTDFAARATYALKQGPFIKAEYERLDGSTRVYGVKADGSVEETRVGLGFALPLSKDVKVYPAADYVINRESGSGGGYKTHGCDHGYFFGGGFSMLNAGTSLYGRAGYYHVSGYGTATTGADALLGIGVTLSELAAVFVETRYAPISNDAVDYDALAIRAGVKLMF